MLLVFFAAIGCSISVVCGTDCDGGMILRHLKRWTTGNTGCPIVGVYAREVATGFSSNRGRQLVADFFVKYLNQLATGGCGLSII